MAKGNEVENGTRRKAKGSKIEGTAQSQSKNGMKKNKNDNDKSSKSKMEGNDGNCADKNEEVLVAPDSETDDGNVEDDVVVHEDDSGDEEEEDPNFENGGGKEEDELTTKTKKKSIQNGKRKKGEGDDDSSTCFPMNRISRIIKSEDADIRITQEAVFMVNKATEKFLELFCKEAHACAHLDSKNQVWYKHLSSVVSKRKRFDFLLDIVPEKVKAEDALAEMSVAET